MIEATEKDIGRRVVYDPRPLLKREYGKLAGIHASGDALVLFDFAKKEYGPDATLRVGSNLHWDDRK